MQHLTEDLLLDDMLDAPIILVCIRHVFELGALQCSLCQMELTPGQGYAGKPRGDGTVEIITGTTSFVYHSYSRNRVCRNVFPNIMHGSGWLL